MIYVEQVDARIWREYGITEQTIGVTILEVGFNIAVHMIWI